MINWWINLDKSFEKNIFISKFNNFSIVNIVVEIIGGITLVEDTIGLFFVSTKFVTEVLSFDITVVWLSLFVEIVVELLLSLLLYIGFSIVIRESIYSCIIFCNK